MSPQLRKTIQNFLLNCDKQIDDIHNANDGDTKYCCVFLEQSMDLLKKCLTKDNNIIEYDTKIFNWEVTKPQD